MTKTIAAVAIAFVAFANNAAAVEVNCADVGKVAKTVMTNYQNGQGASSGNDAADFAYYGAKKYTAEQKVFFEGLSSEYTIRALSQHQVADTAEARDAAVVEFQYNAIMACFDGRI